MDQYLKCAYLSALIPYFAMIVIHSIIIKFILGLFIEGGILIAVSAPFLSRYIQNLSPQVLDRLSWYKLGVLYWLPIGFSIPFSLMMVYISSIGLKVTLILLIIPLIIFISGTIHEFVLKSNDTIKPYAMAVSIPSLWFGGSVLFFGLNRLTTILVFAMLCSFLIASYLFMWLLARISRI